MKKYIFAVTLILIFAICIAVPISISHTERIVTAHIERTSTTPKPISFFKTIDYHGYPLAFVYQVDPIGFVVISADTDLPPIISYSYDSEFETTDCNPGILEELITFDLGQRYEMSGQDTKAMNRELWRRLEQRSREDFVQYPPEGYSPTGGWLKTNWTQNAPYNMYCPMDPVTSVRSVAGCPSVAMGMIINYYETVNGTRFGDSDDYYHSYAGRNYWIDNDYQTIGFASFPQLNSYLDSAMNHYRYQEAITNSDKGAIVWAAGIACRQVYSSAGSGTFNVGQANTAYTRFGFEGFELIDDSSPELYNRIAQNMIDAKPVHLAVVTPSWDAGHNVVVDGYNTDNFFHLNFGWGGQYNGWYLLPSQIPYNLTVIEGAIVDINPKTYLFYFPTELEYLSMDDFMNSQQIEIINVTDQPLNIEGYMFPESINGSLWSITTQPQTLPFVLNPGQSMFLTINVDVPVNGLRELIVQRLRLIHADGVIEIPVTIDTDYISDVPSDHHTPGVPNVSIYPNPFTRDLTIRFDAKVTPQTRIDIFNIKGQHVQSLIPGYDSIQLWNGQDKNALDLAAGVYLFRIHDGQSSVSKKVLKLR